MAALWRMMTAGLAGPLAGALLFVFGVGLVWQSARIEGWPFVGGGLKDQVAVLKSASVARDLADAKARAAVLEDRVKWIAVGQAEARAHLAVAADTQQQIKTIVEKVPIYVSTKNDSACVVPWGAVRLLDAAASGATLDIVRASVAPARADDAPSDVTLSEVVALLATDLGHARQNADQLKHLQAALGPE